jgi:hypothetical protein
MHLYIYFKLLLDLEEIYICIYCYAQNHYIYDHVCMIYRVPRLEAFQRHHEHQFWQRKK